MWFKLIKPDMGPFFISVSYVLTINYYELAQCQMQTSGSKLAGEVYCIYLAT